MKVVFDTNILVSALVFPSLRDYLETNPNP